MDIIERPSLEFNGYHVCATTGKHEYAKLFSSKSAYQQNRERFLTEAERAFERIKVKPR